MCHVLECIPGFIKHYKNALKIALKPETHYSDTMWPDARMLHDKIRSGTAILNEPYNIFLTWLDAMQHNAVWCDKDLGVCHVVSWVE